MKAIEILQEISSENLCSTQFGVVFVGLEMPYNDFIEVFLRDDYKPEENYAEDFISGYVFYCYSKEWLALRGYFGVREHRIKDEFLYVIKIDL